MSAALPSQLCCHMDVWKVCTFWRLIDVLDLAVDDTDLGARIVPSKVDLRCVDSHGIASSSVARITASSDPDVPIT